MEYTFRLSTTHTARNIGVQTPNMTTVVLSTVLIGVQTPNMTTVVFSTVLIGVQTPNMTTVVLST